MKILEIKGFKFDASERRYWNADDTLGLVADADGKWRLLSADGYPSNHALPGDHATYLLSLIRNDDADTVMRRWDNYASTI